VVLEFFFSDEKQNRFFGNLCAVGVDSGVCSGEHTGSPQQIWDCHGKPQRASEHLQAKFQDEKNAQKGSGYAIQGFFCRR
jgi:hypothetical protein